MDWDDIIYLFLLLFSIGFSQIFRSIEDKYVKQNVSTSVGFLIVLLCSGKHTLHVIVTVVINWLILQFSPKSKIHIYSFSFSFLYLLFFRTTEYFGIPYAPSHANLIQMILTLKLVGLSFEVHDSYNVTKIDKPRPESEFQKVSIPNLIQMFHYSFCYIGVLAGPYFSYRSYCDLFNRPFSKYAPCESVTLERAKYLPLYALGYLISSYVYPLRYVTTENYLERGLLYRVLYILPTFFTFRMRMYIGMRLAECVFTMSGLGAYPVDSVPQPGAGPTKNFDYLLTVSKEEKRAKTIEYSFETIYNIEPYGAEAEYTVRSSMKSWNMTVQYWLATNVYRRFPIKKYRMPVTFLVSSLWHGVYAGHYLCLCSVPFYLPIEDIYSKNLRNFSSTPPLLEKCCFIVAYTWRMLLMGYWGNAFALLEMKPALSFWYSVYFLPTIITIIMYGMSFVLFPQSIR